MALLADELSLLPGMSDTGRLGFAIQLKFRQVQGHYPESINDFPSGIVHAIAEQIGCASVVHCPNMAMMKHPATLPKFVLV